MSHKLYVLGDFSPVSRKLWCNRKNFENFYLKFFLFEFFLFEKLRDFNDWELTEQVINPIKYPSVKFCFNFPSVHNLPYRRLWSWNACSILCSILEWSLSEWANINRKIAKIRNEFEIEHLELPKIKKLGKLEKWTIWQKSCLSKQIN